MTVLLGPDEPVDLNNCDREPIHLLGEIQPQGALLALDPKQLVVLQCSANLPPYLGLDQEELQQMPVAKLLSDKALAELHEVVARQIEGAPRAFSMHWRNRDPAVNHLATAHLHQGVLILEVELAAESDVPFIAKLSSDVGSIPRFLQHASVQMQTAQRVDDLYMVIARLVRELNGFDRVMVYRFLEDAHGAVVGESSEAHLESFLGLHYPASDIPPQARRLYELNPLRAIADLNIQSVPIVPRLCPVHGRPLDLTYSTFRSVSRIHIEYLRNMGVAASMSISILQRGQLWGLIACHHYSPRYLPLELRLTCELLGTMAGNYLTARALAEESEAKSRRQHLLADALQTVAAGTSMNEGLNDAGDQLLQVMEAGGLAVCIGEAIGCYGSTPSLEEIARIREFLSSRVREGQSWSTDQLPRWLPVDPQTIDVASGVLGTSITAEAQDLLLFFRPEYRHTVSWGGDPHKPVEETSAGLKLSPRRSFAVWRETIQGRSREWTAADHTVAEDLDAGLNVLVSRRLLEIQRVNEELERLNADLDSFAFAASHDLREPLRNVHQLIFLLEQDLGQCLTPQVQKRMEGLRQSASRMDSQVEALLRLARAGRRDLQRERMSIQEIVDEAAGISLSEGIQRGEVVLTTKQLPILTVDFMCVREIFTNLLTNAAKYNTQPLKQIEVSYVDVDDTESPPSRVRGQKAFAVRDNGIGIAPTYWEKVFEIFRRLHLRDQYGGGSGAGLAIARKVVERHGGIIWVRSQPDQGSTFYFTLASGNHTE